MNILQKGMAEFIGTFLLVLVPLGLATQGQTLMVVSAAFGVTLFIIATAFGPVSGGHFNPSVSAAMTLMGKLSLGELPVYWLAQSAGAVSASWLTKSLWGVGEAKLGAAVPGSGVSWLTVFVVEALGAFILLLVIFRATDQTGEPAIAPLAIGLTLGAIIALWGNVTGGSFNPARYLGPALLSGEWSAAWAYLLAPIVGGLLAAVAYGMLLQGGTPRPPVQ